jgi:hypothetical protein
LTTEWGNVGTRGGGGAGWGPGACPGGNAIPWGVAPQRGQAPGPLIHSTPPLVPTGPWAASTSMDRIPRFGRQNSSGYYRSWLLKLIIAPSPLRAPRRFWLKCRGESYESVLSFAWKDLDPSLALYGQAPSSYSIFRERNGRRPLNISAVAARANTAIRRTQATQMTQMTQMTQTSLGTHRIQVRER